MKIIDAKSYLVHPGPAMKNFLFIRLQTDNGIIGWGEAYTQADRDTQIESHVSQLSRYLEGRNPFHIRHFTQIAYEDFSNKRPSMDLNCAISGIEIAMWDIVGKALDQPIYNLLGGPVRQRFPLYANGWSEGSKSPDDYAEKSIKMVEKGFKSLKFDPFSGPWTEYPDIEVLENAKTVLNRVRDAVGPTINLLIEAHRRFAPMNAIRAAHMMEPFNPYWFEEPCSSDNITAIKEVRDNVSVPIVTGETLYARSNFRELFHQRAADIINPDICNTGGILEITQIAAMAEPYYVAVSPHGWNSTSIGAAAAIHASATMPNFLIYEYMVQAEEVSKHISRGYNEPEDGYYELPLSPGLGVSIDEMIINNYAYRQYPPRNLRTLQ